MQLPAVVQPHPDGVVRPHPAAWPAARTLLGVRLRIVDAFTSRPFSGNPAAVVVLDPATAPCGERSGGESWMWSVAAEVNLSETAFATPTAPGRYDLRWFTPLVEVDLCGHATLATAHALAEDGESGPFRFATRSGELRAAVGEDGVQLDLPAQSTTPLEEPEVLARLAAALGVAPVAVVRTSGGDVLVEVDAAETVRALVVDVAALAAVDARGVIVTAPGSRPEAVADDASLGAPDVVSRFFAPRVGVAEDPVTGSAHCSLAPYWAPRLGRSRFSAHQVSPRGGVLDVELRHHEDGGDDGDRVLLTGRAVTVLDGTLTGPAAGRRSPYTSAS